VVELSWTPAELTFAEMLHATGVIPLPPYLHRHAEADDQVRYQTIYAKHEGSVAAPTAGLHFTEKVFETLAAKNIKAAYVTLHVGAGTFKPVKAEKMQEHEMHAEFIDVSYATVEQLLNHLDRPIIPVGTTSLRTIESLYWIGAKLLQHPQLTIAELDVMQWEPYDTGRTATPAEALQAILNWLRMNSIERLITKTHILIAPGYTLKIASALITNFHQPHSTLLLLIAALVGDEWKRIYEFALQNDFRFLSYGDGCLLWPQQTQ
jgi:S-adenosylmethionine:tRNA ribosyltransferase-isomerase